jgi:hypothetical protein
MGIYTLVHEWGGKHTVSRNKSATEECCPATHTIRRELTEEKDWKDASVNIEKHLLSGE